MLASALRVKPSYLFDITCKSVAQVLFHLSNSTKHDLNLCQALVQDYPTVSFLCSTLRSTIESDILLLTARILRNLLLNTSVIDNTSHWKSCITYCAANIIEPDKHTIQKWPALLLSVLTQQKSHATQFLLEPVDLKLLISEGLGSSDHEVQHYVAQIVRNIILVDSGNTVIDHIDVAILLHLYDNDYPAIGTLALDITKLLLASKRHRRVKCVEPDIYPGPNEPEGEVNEPHREVNESNNEKVVNEAKKGVMSGSKKSVVKGFKKGDVNGSKKKIVSGLGKGVNEAKKEVVNGPNKAVNEPNRVVNGPNKIPGPTNDSANSFIEEDVGEKFREDFVNAEGFDVLMKLLNSPELQDIHSPVLEVLVCLVRFPSSGSLITESVLEFLVTYVRTSPDNELASQTLNLIVEIAANLSDVRHLMSENQIADLILTCLQDEDCYFVGHGCSLISHLILEDLCFSSLYQEQNQILGILCCIVNKGGKMCPWCERVKAVEALGAMVRRDGEMCDKFAVLNYQANLNKYLEEASSDVPDEMISAVLPVLYWVYSKDEHLRDLPLEQFCKLVRSLVHQMQSSNPDIQYRSALLLSLCIQDPIRHCLFVLEPALFPTLHAVFVNATPESEAQVLYARNLQILMSLHPSYVDAVVRQGTLHWLIDQGKSQPLPPLWQELLKTIYDHNLSAKFAYTNMLEPTDSIQPGFYFHRNNYAMTSGQRFQTLEELVSLDLDVTNVVYVLTKKSWATLLRLLCAYDASELPICRSESESSEENMSPFNQQDSLDLDNCSAPDTCYLPPQCDKPTNRKTSPGSISLDEEYSTLVAKSKPSIDVTSSMRLLVEMLAARVLSRLSANRIVEQPSGIQQNSPILSFEELQYGLELECSVLFKLLCDHLTLPCSLHRGSNMREVWTQVYLNPFDWFTVEFASDKNAVRICLNKTDLVL
ncbi:hypothetical protein M8J76_016221 [Diaphorina citri]|nr:hypothetical protein M8J76_016221 [Diaphorina citri]